MTHTDRPADDTWTPCRHHLYELWAAVRPQYRDRVRWRIPGVLWERMKEDPELSCDWMDTVVRGTLVRTLLGQRVDLIPDGGTAVQIVITDACKPTRGRS